MKFIVSAVLNNSFGKLLFSLINSKVSSSLHNTKVLSDWFLIVLFSVLDYGVEADPKGSLQQLWAVIEVKWKCVSYH
jgi:hypothetical protein